MTLATGAWECEPPIYEFEQYKPGSSTSWQKFLFFKNVPRWMLCASGASECWGTMDKFRMTAQEGQERDWFMFFGRTDGDYDGQCFDEEGNFLIGCSYRWWEPGRFTSDDRGRKDTGVLYPLGGENMVHWVRHYDRGACAAQWSQDNVLELRDAIAGNFQQAMSDSWAIHTVDINSSSIRFELGVPPTQRDDVNADNHDFIVFQASYHIKPWSAGSWDATISLKWRFDVGSRAEYLYCGDDHNCDRDPYLHCVTDEDCTKHVHGAQCTAYATEESPGVCYKGPSLVIRDYEFDFHTHKNCQGDLLFCKTYYSRFKQALQDIKADQYRQVFLPLLNQINEGMWSVVPKILSWQECNEDEDCYDQMSNYGPNLEYKCAAAPDTEDFEGYDRACFVRPGYIWGVNEYPWTMEFVLVPVKDTNAYPEYGLFVLDPDGSLCQVERAAKWSDIGRIWVNWSEPEIEVGHAAR